MARKNEQAELLARLQSRHEEAQYELQEMREARAAEEAAGTFRRQMTAAERASWEQEEFVFGLLD